MSNFAEMFHPILRVQLILALSCLGGFNLIGQSVYMGVQGKHEIKDAGYFYDSGGAKSSYKRGANEKTVICAPASQSAEITFTMFEVESAWDILYAYSGESESAPFIREYTGNQNPGKFLLKPAECICFVFTSDGTNEGKGWEAELNVLLTGKEIKAEGLREVKLPVNGKQADHGVYRSTPIEGNGSKEGKSRNSGIVEKRQVKRKDFEQISELKKEYMLKHPEQYEIID
jgi:hypothetical protein